MTFPHIPKLILCLHQKHLPCSHCSETFVTMITQKNPSLKALCSLLCTSVRLFQINSLFLVPRECKNLSVSPKKNKRTPREKTMPRINNTVHIMQVNRYARGRTWWEKWTVVREHSKSSMLPPKNETCNHLSLDPPSPSASSSNM